MLKKLNIFLKEINNELNKKKSNNFSSNISILTKQKLDDNLLGQKYLGTEQVNNYISESNDGMRGSHSNVYNSDVYGYLTYIGEKDDRYIYDFYYLFDGKNRTTLDDECNVPFYLIMNYNIRDCILLDRNENKIELNQEDYDIEIHASLEINGSSFGSISSNYRYKLINNKTNPSDLNEVKNIDELIDDLLRPKDLNRLIRMQCGCLSTKCINARIALSLIPRDITISDYLKSKFTITNNYFVHIEESLKNKEYSLDFLVKEIINSNIEDATDIPENILIRILNKYPEMIAHFDISTLPESIINKYAKDNISWLKIPVDKLKCDDILSLLDEMKKAKEVNFYKYREYFIKALDTISSCKREKCLDIMDSLDCISNGNRKYIYLQIKEESRLLDLLSKYKWVTINDLEGLDLHKCSTELLISALKQDYDIIQKSQNGTTFYLIVEELLNRRTVYEVDIYINDSLIINNINLKIRKKIETHHIGWVINSIYYSSSMDILELFTEDNIKENIDAIFEGLIDIIKSKSNEPLLYYIKYFSNIIKFLKYLSNDKKLIIKNYVLDNINKRDSILEYLGFRIKHLTDALDFNRDDYIKFYLNTISSRCTAYINSVMPEDLLNELKDTLILPCPNYNWTFLGNAIEFYVGDKVKSREEFKDKMKSNPRIFEKALAIAEGEKDGEKIKIDNIYKWLFGVPNQHGFLFYRTEYNRVYLPERTPMKVVCLIKEILGIEE